MKALEIESFGKIDSWKNNDRKAKKGMSERTCLIISFQSLDI
jgi:hypothetical protein